MQKRKVEFMETSQESIGRVLEIIVRERRNASDAIERYQQVPPKERGLVNRENQVAVLKQANRNRETRERYRRYR
jgi:hypothetical protein